MSGWDLAVIELLERLACLSLTEAERIALGADLEKIVTAAERLAQLDLSEFTPMTHAMELADVLRLDVCVPCSSVEAALANAPDYAGGYYRVPQVLES